MRFSQAVYNRPQQMGGGFNPFMGGGLILLWGVALILLWVV